MKIIIDSILVQRLIMGINMFCTLFSIYKLSDTPFNNRKISLQFLKFFFENWHTNVLKFSNMTLTPVRTLITLINVCINNMFQYLVALDEKITIKIANIFRKSWFFYILFFTFFFAYVCFKVTTIAILCQWKILILHIKNSSFIHNKMITESIT